MKDENPLIEISPGIRRRTITSGATMYQMRAELDAGSRLPEHSHPQEQIAHVISGRMRMFVAGIPQEMTAGDAVYLPSNVPHRVETLEDTVVIDTFSPPRDDYLALDEKARERG
jgi:quercetin dioxygenase-like cupin family protein